MILEFFQHTYFIGIVFTLIVLSVLCQIMIGVLYQNLLQETDNMAITDNRLLKQCKLKFSNCYELNKGNINIPVYVDKFMSQIRFARMTLTSMTHLPGQLMLLSVFVAGLGACIGIISGQTLGELMPYYIVSLFGLYVYFSVTALVDIKTKGQLLRTSLIDYLENHMIKQLELVQEKEMQPFIHKKSEGRVAEQEEKHTDSLFTCGEQEELERLLREFLA